MKNFRFTTKLLMGAAVAFALSAPLASCSDDDDDDDVEPTPTTNNNPSGPTAQEDAFAAHFDANSNVALDLGTLDATNLIPSTAPAAGTMPPAGFFDQVNYKGAFGSTDWTAGWTYLSGNTTFDNNKPTKTVTDATLNGSATFSKDTIYILDGFVFVDSLTTLTIDAGTVIKGKSGQGASASALIVARGGTLNANGTANDPIIMTYEGDNGSGQAANVRGQWGGLIVLGSASLNSNPGQTQVEGIPSTEPRGFYGGSNDADNSGTITYVSIRHGGTDIGAGNEINGLTFAGVGSGTTVNYVEVAANKDDGFEFFGGTVNTKHLVASYCADDSYDYDEGFRGMGQYWLVVQVNDSDRGGEHDGGTDPETATPYATPVIYNATYIGNGSSRALTFRDNAGGEYHNSIFHNFGKGIDIEDLSSGEDSYSRFSNGDLALKGNVFSQIGAGTGSYDIFTVTVP
ncbi:MAG: hypothetical protein RIC95_07250 [Vicingaceae bacterium]